MPSTSSPRSRTRSASTSVGSSSSSAASSFARQGAQMLNKLRSVDPWSYVVMGLIALYIALVNPSNTPAFFSNPVFKFVLFAFVAIVCVLEGSCIGVLFAVAMALPVVYSSMREGYANPFLEGFDEDDIGIVEDEEQRRKHNNHHGKHHGKHHDGNHHGNHHGNQHDGNHRGNHHGNHHGNHRNNQ